MPASLFDTSTWLAAVFPAHPCHNAAQKALNSATPASPAAFCRATQQSFLRLLSTPALLKTYGAEGMTNRDALALLHALLRLDQVSELEEPPGTVGIWHRLGSRDFVAPKVWMDAYLAAFAIAGDLTFVSLDQDFKKFAPAGLKLMVLNT